MEPLQILLRKGVEWKWRMTREKALMKINKILTIGPILACPDSEHPFKLYTDTSDTSLGMSSSSMGNTQVQALFRRILF